METWLWSCRKRDWTDFSKVSLSQTLGFTIPFISLHPWNHPNNKTLQVRWANFRVISELTQNSWKSRKNEQFTPRRKPCCLITTSWEDLNVTNLTDPAQQRPRRWAGGRRWFKLFSTRVFGQIGTGEDYFEEMGKKSKTFNFSKDLVNSGTGCLPHGKQWNMSLLDLLGLGPIFHWTCHDYGRKGLSTLVLGRNWMVWDLLVWEFYIGSCPSKGAIARTEGQQRNWRFFLRRNENNKSKADPIQQAVKPKNHGCLTGPPPSDLMITNWSQIDHPKIRP